MSDRPIVSVIATVFNEGADVGEWLDALLAQRRLPDEIVIVDGGSHDRTVDVIERRRARSSVPIVLLVSPGANIAQGRNRAIEHAAGDLIAVTDAGTCAAPAWLERLIAPLDSGEADVASGFFVPRVSSRWQRALAATTLPDAAEVDPDKFLPSSRSMAFRRAWFDAGVRYPEWLDYCEDLVWDMAMTRAGAHFTFVQDAIVTFTVRPSPRSFAVQYARYARGDGKAGLFARRHAVRYTTYAGLGVVLWRRRAPEMLLATVFAALYMARPIRRLWIRDRASHTAVWESIVAIPLVAALRALGDGAKMAGYPVGLIWRWLRFGALGWRTAWPRISPAGESFRPAAMTRESQLPGASPVVGSPAEPR